MRVLFFVCTLFLSFSAWCQQPGQWQGKFEQLDQILPTPNEYRSGSGSPGPQYWQQKADYEISVELNDITQVITGSEKITYHNNSPDVLKYLWLQLDQNIFDADNNTTKTTGGTLRDTLSAKQAAGQLNLYDFDGGFKIKSVKDASGKVLAYTINKTMMRIDLPQPLKNDAQFSFNIEWSYRVNDRSTLGGRSGYEFFPEDGNYVYTIAQFFPRLCVYDDVVGWQNKQFLGRGEFALAFGDYKVNITVPADHIIAATGMLKNASLVLTKPELERFEKAKNTFDKPVIIITQEEAVKKEKTKSTEKRTWQFEANNVRDFAFASSRKFIWDAMAVKIGSNTPLAMSYYSKEGNPLWEKESTLAVKNTLEVYSKYTIDYPYPQATSVHAASIGMEYPMICFNFGRPGKDGTVTPQLRQGMIGVVVHEVGHNFFPMIINSDERQMTWMDEGLDSFVQLLTELERYPDIDWSRGKPAGIVPYMKGDKNLMRPLMTNSEQVIQFGSEQYAKAATALFILRETVMGKELFDKAFKEYAQRWAFKHPKPADFFRTMEDASAVDLDWFWRGWFYTTDSNDQSIDQVKWFRMRTDEKNVENKNVTAKKGDLSSGTSDKKTFTDFSAGPQPFSVIPSDDRLYGEFKSRINDKEVMEKLQEKNIYEVKLSNKGGLVMPVVIEWTFKDGTKEIERIPAEIWRTNETTATKVFVKEKEVVSMILDPQKETADVSLNDNVFPRSNEPSKFDKFKTKN
jgi:hypothetical protein